MLKYFFGAPILPEKQKRAWEETWLTLIMSLGYTAHSIWDSSHEQIGSTQTKKKKEEVKRHFKFQAENYEISVCLNLSVSQCVSLF